MKNVFAIIALLMLALFATTANAGEYTVQKGDCLWAVAKKQGVSPKALKDANKEISSRKYIHPGDVLVIPGAEKTAVPTSNETEISKEVSETVQEEVQESETAVEETAAAVVFENNSSAVVEASSEKKSNINTATVAEKKTEKFEDVVSSLKSKGVKPFLYKKPGADPDKKGTTESSLKILKYPEQVQELLKNEVQAQNFKWGSLKRGDYRQGMTFGRKRQKVRNDVVVAIEEQRELATKVYEVSFEDKTYSYEYILWCGNSTRPPEKEIPKPPKEEPPTAETPKTDEPTDEPVEVPEGVPIPQQQVCKDCPPEHEPIIGAGMWGNGIASGHFAYGEYLLWLKANCESEWAFGIGFYGNWDEGESKLSDYTWDGWGIGPQVGVKWTSTYLDKEAGKHRFQQWQGKFRLLFEYTDGRNPTSGYSMSQYSLKPGVYTEYVRQLNDKDHLILTAEGWMDVGSKIKSTWSGDTPQNRIQAMLSVYGQHKFSDDWSVRYGGGIGYQGWDQMVPFHLRAEARWRETVMFGPYANLFFWKTSVYKGISLGNLQTIGGFVRIELGGIVRYIDNKRRMERVKALDEQMFGKIVDDPEMKL
jgi:LysM repeat protein